VTHCGWNSVLEAVAAGVPMLCWPLEAEQKMNKVCMTEDMGIAVELVGYGEGFVKAGEVDAKVRMVKEGEEGRQLRARVAARKEEAEAALEEGGASRAAFLRFLLDVESIREPIVE
jgi:UDP:flavonoid glycosyltransferase YjiC (YdhE family)